MTIINVSRITDYSGEPPIVTYSNTVTTVIRQVPTPPRIIRSFYYLPCRSCGCGCNRCGCNCGCNRCRNCCNNCCCG